MTKTGILSLIIIVLIIVIAIAMYVIRGVGPGFQGVPRILEGHPMYNVIGPILAIILLIILGYLAYYISKRVRV
ncbi:MAG: hypothetical protein RQ922_01365 [Thermoproteota archaeon]|jgi:heme/copper-type cytochrome/quinol oxidase subunit 2|nr:hypothetical protein [Thermoproteota archaeon]